jgi:hypothetical protein
MTLRFGTETDHFSGAGHVFGGGRAVEEPLSWTELLATAGGFSQMLSTCRE